MWVAAVLRNEPVPRHERVRHLMEPAEPPMASPITYPQPYLDDAVVYEKTSGPRDVVKDDPGHPKVRRNDVQVDRRHERQFSNRVGSERDDVIQVGDTWVSGAAAGE